MDQEEQRFRCDNGAQDGAEIADITGIYLLKQINDFLSSKGENCHAGLYRDDGLVYIENSNGPLINKIEKALHRIFKRNSLSISVEQKGNSVNFLDVTLETDGSYKPYKKPNNKIIYVNRASNHPPSIIRNIPTSIQRRLATISSSENEFMGAREEYQKALKDAGYSEELKYEPEEHHKVKRKRNRRRKIIWFNPPYSENVATNIGKEFFDLIRIHFPKQHPFNRLFNKNTVKLSYSCTINMASIIKAHNTKILIKDDAKQANEERQCNCREKSSCPVKNTCLRKNVVYKATVQHGENVQSYIGMTETTFKTRFTQHKSSFRNNKHRKQTELASLIWALNDKNVEFKVKWDIIDQAQPYKPGKITCNLCLSEKYHILTGENLINRKSELLNKCPHKRKYLAHNIKP